MAQDLTRTDIVVGTPRYMAPEQLSGGSVDPPSDQFSFAVALFIALYGRHPFPGKSLRERQRIIARGVIERPRATRVPARIHRALTRALEADPSRRFESMRQLVDALTVDRWARRRRAALVMALVVVAVGLVARELRAGHECQLDAGVFIDIWDAGARGEVERAFLTSGHATAEHAFSVVRGQLDAYVDRLGAARRDVCLATRRRREESEEVMEARLTCLDQRRAELGAFVALLRRADGALVDRAPLSVHELSSVQNCLELSPDDTDGVATSNGDARAVAQLRAGLASVKAQLLAGRVFAAVDSARIQVRAADALGRPGIRAEALYLLGEALTESKEYAESERVFRTTYNLADARRLDALRADVSLRLIQAAGFGQRRLEEARWWIAQADATARRLGEPPLLKGRVANARAVLALFEGRFAEGLPAAEAALPPMIAAVGRRHPWTNAFMVNRANLLFFCGRYEEARAAASEASKLGAELFGESHAKNAAPLWLEARALVRLGRADEAVPMAERAVTLVEQTYGPAHLHSTWAIEVLGEAYRGVGRLEDAVSVSRRTLGIRQRALGSEAAPVASARYQLGLSLQRAERHREAVRQLRDALRVQQATLRPEHPEIADTRKALDDSLSRLGEG
jgi:tetratricopeptide (TPR) repeat protein